MLLRPLITTTSSILRRASTQLLKPTFVSVSVSSAAQRSVSTVPTLGYTGVMASSTPAPASDVGAYPEPSVPANITPSEIEHFRSTLSPNVRSKAWLLVLTSALVSCHHGPETVVPLYELAFSEAVSPLPSASNATESQLAEVSRGVQRKIQETLVKGSIIFGIPQALDTVFVLLEHIRSTSPPSYLLTQDDFARASSIQHPISSLKAPAYEALDRVYKHNLTGILDGKMADNMPDLKFLTLEINYGFTLANQQVINWKETELVVLASLVTQNCRAEVLWHMRGALRAGWAREDVESVRQVSKDIARRLGVRTERVPGLEEVSEHSND